MKKILLHLILCLVLLGMLFPFLWMILISVRESTSDFTSIFTLFEGRFSLKNYRDVLTSGPFGIYLFNSFFISIISTIGNVFFCSTVAYALARRNFKFKYLLEISVIGVLMIPQQVVMIPLYRMMASFNLINTYWALIIPILVTPFRIFLLKQYIENIPVDMEDAAKIDGAGDWRILFKIILPITKPALIVLGVFQFLNIWNSFLYPFLFTNDESMRTLTVGLTFYLGNQSVDWGHLMAGSSISAIPVIILFIIFQKQIIQGMTDGAVKG
ncbi:MAG: carbohydrate ABC transporter permease [Chlorobi bacterium]|nr:carbohydrate ABC transporter permease [Chlorobiota bacterium]